VLLAAVIAAAAPSSAPDPNVLARAGTAALDAGRFGDALTAFTGAAALQPDDATLCFGAGVAAFMLGRDDEAQARFECALTLNPTFLPAAEWLGDLHYHAGRLREAIAVYDAASRRLPERRELQRQLESWRRQQELHSRFRELQTDHFAVLFETVEGERLAGQIGERLEAAYLRIGKTLGIQPSRRVTVVLYTREQFDEITRLAGWSVAAYDGCIRLPLGGALAEPEELDRVVSHEFVHALIETVAGRTVPGWLNEGLATVLEPAGSDDAEAVLARTEARLAPSTLRAHFAGLNRRDAEIAYGSAARAVRRLIERRGVPALIALLEDLARGVPFDEAFRHRMAMRFDQWAALVAP
jgi:tetratricopeptide (TPR) repeat protein